MRVEGHRACARDEDMVDRVYKADLPALRKRLELLRENFSRLRLKTNWNKLRIDPLLKHAMSLERVWSAEEFSQESSRLTRGVAMFHSDLVYFRTNVRALEEALEVAQKVSGPKRPGPGSSVRPPARSG